MDTASEASIKQPTCVKCGFYHHFSSLCPATPKALYARDGFPLETIKGRPITNFFRKLFLTNWWKRN